MFIVSVIAKVNHMMQFFLFFTSNVQFVRLAAGRPTQAGDATDNGAIDETLQQFAPLSDYCLLQLVDCRESSTLIDHLLNGTPDSAIDCMIQLRAVLGPHVRLDERDVLTPQVRRCVPGSV